jgi:hypothetical protein
VEKSLFDLAAEKLEQHTGFSQLEARGTLRIAVKSAGLSSDSIALDELRVIFQKLMPGELEKRGVSDIAGTCAAVMSDLESAPAAATDSASITPDDIFRRLAKT